jgi:hypothetical protein
MDLSHLTQLQVWQLLTLIFFFQDLLGPPLPPAGLHIRGQKIGNPEMHLSRDELIGSAFIAFGITLFVCFFYVAIVSKLLPPYENQFLAAIQEDW